MERRLGYRPGLDGIRAVAIGLVLLNHTGLSVFLGGGNGVIVFFVLSGFLITKLMIEEWDRSGGVSYRGFYGRRAVRILPAPTVMLLTLLVATPFITEPGVTRSYVLKEILASATYTMNMRPLLFDVPIVDGEAFNGFLGHMWSLAVEEQFYLVWPLFFVLVLAPVLPQRRRVPGWLVIGAAVIAAVRLVVYLASWANSDLASISLFSFDAFALGAALAFALHHGTAPALERLLVRPVVPIAGLAVLAFDLLAGRWTHEIESLYVCYSAVAAASVIGHVMVAPDSAIGKLLALGPVVWIGKLSYSIYLWHNPIWVYFSTDRFDQPVVVLTLAEWACTVVAVMVSYYLIEKPFLRLRGRFVPAPPPADPTTSVTTSPGAQRSNSEG